MNIGGRNGIRIFTHSWVIPFDVGQISSASVVRSLVGVTWGAKAPLSERPESLVS